MKEAHPAAAVAVWAEDEHRLGLRPVVRRGWAPKGRRPTAHVRRRYEWLDGYGSVRPSTGQSWWCLLPTVTTEAFALALAAFARDEGIDAAHRAALVVDQAGWHVGGVLAVQEGIDPVLLPAASPERQPAGRLWPLVDEAVLADRCRRLEADPQRLNAHTHFHWWPPEPAAPLRQ